MSVEVEMKIILDNQYCVLNTKNSNATMLVLNNKFIPVVLVITTDATC